MKNRKSNRSRKQNRFLYTLLVSLILITATLLQKDSESKIVIPIFATKDNAEKMQVHFIDVGQGDSILIESNHEYMLIDAGNNEDGEVVVDYLLEEGVDKLKYIIATHPHEDHIGGMDDVIKQFDVETVLMPDVVHTTKTFEDVLSAIASKNLEITTPLVGEQYKIGEAKFTIVTPDNEIDESNLNNASIGIKLVNGSNSFLMCGDAEKSVEKEMLKEGIDVSAQVYKVSHHGSETSTSSEFLKAVSPEYAVISCGADNKYGHPHIETLRKLSDLNVEVFRTDVNGTIIAESDGNTITWKTKK